LWRFYDFLDARGVNLVRQWLDEIPPAAAAKIDARLLFMRAIPIWPEQYVSALHGYPGLVEPRVVASGVQYRPLAFYGPGERALTIVIGAVEKGKIPKRILETAYERRRIVLAETGRISEHAFDRGSGRQ
jgi:hypothetical protein